MKIENKRKINKTNIIYHKRHKSDSFHKSKNMINQGNNNNKEKNKKPYQSFDSNTKK